NRLRRRSGVGYALADVFDHHDRGDGRLRAVSRIRPVGREPRVWPVGAIELVLRRAGLARDRPAEVAEHLIGAVPGGVARLVAEHRLDLGDLLVRQRQFANDGAFADLYRILSLDLRAIDDIRLQERAAVGDGGVGVRHLQRRRELEALTDGEVHRVTARPAVVHVLQLPLRIRHDTRDLREVGD